MGFLKKLFGGDKKAPPPPPVRPRPPRLPERGEPQAAPAEPETADVEAMDVRQLTRLLNARDAGQREAAAARLANLGERSALRPLMNAYLNYGDALVLKALATYGDALVPAARREASDIGIIGTRRARVMDILGVTGSDEVLGVVREATDDIDLEIHTRACVALARLGDVWGIDRLADDLRLTDPQRRTMALEALREIGTDRAKVVLDEHVRRYLAEGGAVPASIEVHAPLLENPDRNLITYVTEHIKRAPHALTVVIGSMAIQMASNKRDVVKEHLAGWDIHFSIPTMAPEEQIAALLASRDAAAADADARAVFFGMLPAPHDNPPLPHFLTRPADIGKTYTAKIISVDPHEYMLLQDWLHYIQDKSEVPTDFEVILAASRPGKSAMSAEEYDIYQMTPEERRNDFARAYLAHL